MKLVTVLCPAGAIPDAVGFGFSPLKSLTGPVPGLSADVKARPVVVIVRVPVVAVGSSTTIETNLI